MLPQKFFATEGTEEKEEPHNPLCPLRLNLPTVYAALGPASLRCGTLAATVGWNYKIFYAGIVAIRPRSDNQKHLPFCVPAITTDKESIFLRAFVSLFLCN
jgi:hypothetical protein